MCEAMAPPHYTPSQCSFQLSAEATLPLLILIYLKQSLSFIYLH